MLIDIRREIFRKDMSYLQDCEQDLSIKKQLTAKQIQVVEGNVNLNIRRIISSIRCTDPSGIRVGLLAIERNLEKISLSEEIEEKLITDSIAKRAYKALSYFFSGDQTKIEREMELNHAPFESSTEKLEAISKLSGLSLNLCLKNFKEDLDQYVVKNSRLKPSKKDPTHKKLETMGRILEAAEEVENQDPIPINPIQKQTVSEPLAQQRPQRMRPTEEEKGSNPNSRVLGNVGADAAQEYKKSLVNKGRSE